MPKSEIPKKICDKFVVSSSSSNTSYYDMNTIRGHRVDEKRNVRQCAFWGMTIMGGEICKFQNRFQESVAADSAAALSPPGPSHFRHGRPLVFQLTLAGHWEVLRSDVTSEAVWTFGGRRVTKCCQRETAEKISFSNKRFRSFPRLIKGREQKRPRAITAA